MISCVNELNVTAVHDFCKNSLLGTKISCYLSVYGFERNFCSFWIVHDDEADDIYGVILKFENSVTVLAEDIYDCGELSAFLSMTEFDELICEEELALKLDLSDFITRKSYYIDKADGLYNAENLSEQDLPEAYKLISLNIPDSFTDSKYAYLSFASDFIFRKRRGFSRIKGIKDADDVISCALTSAETDSAAIMSGVASDSTRRLTGLGKRLVLSLAKELISENKKVYIIALNKSAEGFYEHIGFNDESIIAFYERKN